MSDEAVYKGGRPKCPNHNEFLEDIPRPTPRQGKGRCPVSKCWFEFECDPQETVNVMNKDGTVTKVPKLNITGNEKN